LAATTDPDRELRSATPCVDVEPLDLAAIAELVELATGAAPTSEHVEWVHAMSGGNPSFAEQLLDAATSAASELAEPGPQARPLIRRRLDELDAAARHAIEVAAVCGPIVPAAVLEDLAPPAGVDGLLASSLLVEASPADVAEAGLPPSVDAVFVFRHGA